ncbi:MAG: SH3 domain-containing protein [Caldilineaceae bacterium]|nr:SH3 domain-containing protein [Caldilineaceae bacterium]
MFPLVQRSWMPMLSASGLAVLILCLALATTAAQASDRTTAAPALLPPASLLLSPPPQDAGGASSNANLRQGPGTNYPVVGGVKAGAPLEIVAKNEAGDWYQLAAGNWIFAALVDGAPDVPVAAAPAPAAAPAQEAAPATGGAPAPAGGGWVQVADAAADFPGGRDRNHWYYLWTEGRGNFIWQDMQQTDGAGCYHDTGGRGLEICADSMTANPKGDVGLQWKASRGGTYRFEWDSASLKFYKHGEFVGILDAGTQLPYATTVTDVIEWEMFFWVAADSTNFHVKVFRLDEPAAAAGAPASAAPAAPVAAPSAPSLSFGGGLQIVGSDIAPGTYRGVGGGYCYWERITALYSASRSIIANELGYGPQIVTIAASDKAFDSRRCGTWTLDLSPITASPTDPFDAGMYFVGKDVAPGTWQSDGGDVCYWARLSGFSGQLRDIKENDIVAGPTVVTIEAGDQGFYSQRCGTWTKIN